MFRRRRAPDDFATEIRSHLELEVERLREDGMSPDQAEAAARRAFGNVTLAQERYYEHGRWLLLDHLRQDVRFALRLLARTPLLTAAIVATLALGIGAASAVFSLVHAVVLRPLDYDHPDRLVQLFETGKREGGESDWASLPNFRDWRSKTDVFEDMAAYRYSLVTLTGAEGAETFLGLECTDRLFSVLGVEPLLGRTFIPGEDRPGREQVAVLSHGLWQRRFDADPGVIGRVVTLDGRPYSIVGVMPASFDFPNSVPGYRIAPRELWIPMRPSDDVEDRGSHNYWAVARLAPGVTLNQARAVMRTLADNLARQYPESNKDLTVTVLPLKVYVAGPARQALLLLLTAIGAVLLLMCANIANLLLSRADARRREMAMRQALGASRARLVAQTLTESLVLALGGAAAGLAVAYYATSLLVRLAPQSLPRIQDTAVDAQVLGFMVLVTGCVGVLFGLAPAFWGSGVNVQQALKEGGARVSGSAIGARIRQGLVVTQLALAVMLLVAAGLLLRSFVRVTTLDLGFNVSRLMTALVNLPPARYGDPAQQVVFFENALRRIQTVPGVVSAAVSDSIPLTGINNQGSFIIEGRPALPPGASGPHANRPHVSANYFETMGLRLIDGRLFDARDRGDSQPVAIISDLAARMYWPGVSPLGKRLATEWVDGRPTWRQIVGVVQATHHFGLEAPQKAEVYVPHQQSPSPFMQLVVRTQGDPAAVIDPIRHEIAAMDPEQPAFAFQTMESLLAEAGAQRRFQTALVSAFAVLALLLAAIGVYGVMGHMVMQRSREIGVRLALGALSGDVVGMVLRSGLRLTVAGIAAGLAGALAVSGVLRTFLFGVSSLDPLTYVGVATVLVLVALLATYLPSRAASRLDPLIVLREE
jgi:putative ABC transport system permease protein